MLKTILIIVYISNYIWRFFFLFVKNSLKKRLDYYLSKKNKK